MLKRILCAVLSLSMLAFLPAVITGCEKEDEIVVKKETKVENVPAGSRVKLTGDNP
jgi:hypothetical protein